MLKDFYNYLTNLGLSSNSHKNYRSDLNHFSGWLIQKARALGSSVETFSDAIPFLNQQAGLDYKNYLSKNNIPVKTVNRRLSTLRHLSNFLFSSGTLDFNFMKNQANIAKSQDYVSEAITNFAKFLEKEKVSSNTSKNYLSDVRQLFQTIT